MKHILNFNATFSHHCSAHSNNKVPVHALHSLHHVCVYTKSILTSYKAENGVMQTKNVTQICCELTTLVVTVHPLGAVASCQNFCLKFLTKHTVGSILLPSSSLMILRIMSHGLYSICASLIKHSEAVRCHTR